MEINEVKQKFRGFLDEIPTGKFNSVQQDIIRECRITKNIFRNWKLMHTCPPPLAQEKINKIALRELGKEIFEM